MKRLLFLLVIIVSLSFGQAQVNADKSPNAMDFYPLHKGDVWHSYFRPMFVGNDSLPFGYSITRWITDIDTVAPNTHYIYYNNNPLTRTKVDPENKIIYIMPEDEWIPYLNLGLPVRSYWWRDSVAGEWILFQGEDTAEVFGRFVPVRTYYTYYDTPFGDTSVNMPAQWEYFALGIGRFFSGSEGGDENLIGCIINGVPYGATLDVEDGQNTLLPEDIKLEVYPNPFNPETVIAYSLKEKSNVTLAVYNIAGQKVAELISGEMEKGMHETKFNGTKFSSGVYIFRLNAQSLEHGNINYTKTIKALLLK
jgi:hypothetical protein